MRSNKALEKIQHNVVQLILIFMLFIGFQLQAQVVITGHSFIAQQVNVNSVLKIQVHNFGPTEAVVNVDVELRDLNSGQVVLTAISRAIPIAPGVQNISSAQAQTEVRFNESSSMGRYVASHQVLPSGEFDYCIFLEDLNQEPLQEICFPILSNFSSFLNLVNPSDKSVIETTEPILNWIHSGLVPSIDPAEKFELILVELEDGQQPGSALAMNSPLCYVNDLKNHSLIYPMNAVKLEKGKSYAWQVHHSYEGSLLESSEQWEFRIEEDPVFLDSKYVDLSRSKKGDKLDVYRSFFFRFDESYVVNDVKVEIRDKEMSLIQPELIEDGSTAIITRQGFNGFELDLTPYNLKKGDYTISVFDGKGKEYAVIINYRR